MSVDMGQLQRIHAIEIDVADATKTVKGLKQKRTQLVEGLPEYQALQEALEAAQAARMRLKLAIVDSYELVRLEEQLAEARYKQRDVTEILSHHLVIYTQDTGREVIKDREGRTRQIELRAKEGKAALDQVRLPLGLDKHFGARVEIPEAPPAGHLEAV
jgi:uncharacterized protein YPO0396